MFICRVLLGKQQKMAQPKNGMIAPDKGYHSVFGSFKFNEYIVYRYGQGKPFMLIEYKA